MLSPLLANVALSVLDESLARHPGGASTGSAERRRRRGRGLPNHRLVRYADDFLILVSGRREHAEQLRDHAARILEPMGLRLSVDKTRITHLDEGFDFLGWRIQRHRKRGTDRQYVYTYPARKSLRAVTAKVKELTGRQNVGLALSSVLHRLNSAMQGWCAYFRPGVSSVAFRYLSHYAWMRVVKWIRRKHPGITWKQLRRRYCGGGWWPTTDETELFNPAKVSTTRYRYRGTLIPSPWPATA